MTRPFRSTVLCAFAIAGCAAADAPAPTFSDDVAPIVYRECVPCHRAGGEGPFALDSFAHVRRVGKQLDDVVQSGYMPPWLPAETDRAFVGARRLRDEDKRTLHAWVAAGMPEGDAASAPTPPRFDSGWRLGAPDRVIEMAEPYRLGAEGRDEYRNFVLEAPLESTRWIAAIEFDPGNRRAVHHARILVDPSAASRARDRADPGPGYGGMSTGDARPPDGVILGWAPGKVAKHNDALAWRLEPGTDVVLQLHLVPTGREETVRARIALYDADGPPPRPSFSVLLGTREIDIPAGAEAHPVTDEYTLPVDVEALALYPHAHYLAKTMNLRAELPGGDSLELLRIDNWDFDWQDDYTFAAPVPLPAGTKLAMRYTYDNSAGNVRNPNHPPRRVRYGAQSSDEMAEMLVQVVPARAGDLPALARHYEQHTIREALAWRIERLQEYPEDTETLAAIGNNYVLLGEVSKGLQFLRAALERRPGDAALHVNYGWAYERLGSRDNAARQYGRALRIDAGQPDALANLGRLLRDEPGALGQAIALHRELVARRPRDAPAWVLLGETLRRAGADAEALEAFERALALVPDDAAARLDAAWLLATRPDPAEGDRRRAEALARDLLEDDGSSATPHAVLAAALAAEGRFDEARRAIDDALAVARPNEREELERQRGLYRAGRRYSPASTNTDARESPAAPDPSSTDHPPR